MTYRVLLVLVLGMCVGIAGQARAQTPSASTIAIEQPWARATPAGAKTGAAYLTIINRGSASDRLVSASTPMASKVQFHEETNDNGIMRMRELPSLEIQPGATVTFKPGGMHIMLVGVKQQIKEGQTFPLVLKFEKAGEIDLQIPVAKAGAMGVMKGM
jgi:hypothetical protein